ncbi:MAG: hypothetical protein JXQ87_11955 [Bacteroidia bacterium]
MVKRLVFSLIAYAPFFAFAQSSYADFPDLDSVLNQFCSTYSGQPTSYLQFEKRPNGWWVSEVNYSNLEKVKSEHYWSQELNVFKEISFPILENIKFHFGLHGELKQRHPEHLFRSNIFYGYVGWENDVIETFEKKKGLSNEELYALGRAYSSLATGYLFNNSEFANSENIFEFKSGGNSLSKAQIATYTKARKNAIKHYELINSKDPNFETIVGSINTKVSNGYLTAYLDLLIYQNKEEALKFLNANLYDDYNISAAKNYLSSCPLNAILFTYGDNDTYPLLYVQEQLGFRKDVKVINLNLLNNVAYMDMLKREGIEFKTKLSIFDNEARPYFQVINQGFEVSIDDLIEYAADDKNTQEYNGSTVHTVYGDYYNVADLFSFRANKSYLTRSDLILYDIINTNFWDRPICFGFGVEPRSFAGLQDHCKLQGFVYQLTPYKKQDYNGTGYIDAPQQLFNKLTLELDWSSIKHIHQVEKSQLWNQRQLFFRLAKYYDDSTGSDSAKIVIEFANKVIPNKSCPYLLNGVRFTQILFNAGEKAKALEMADVTLQNLDNELNDLKALNQNPSYILSQKQLLESILDYYGKDD